MDVLFILVVAQVFSGSSLVQANPIETASSTIQSDTANSDNQNILAKILENQSIMLEKVNKIETDIKELKNKTKNDHHNYDHEIQRSMKLNDDFEVAWETCGTTKSITFTIIARTLGYIGFGISPSGLMDQADLVIGGLNTSGHYFGDYHGEGHTPILDTNQSWQLLSANQNQTHTTLVVTRPLNTNDTQDVLIGKATTKFMWAMGETDNFYHHLKRGSGSVNILDKKNSQLEEYHNQHEVHRRLVLDPQLEVEWEICGASKTITFNITANTLGYFQFGISPTGQLAEADVFVQEAKNGTTNFANLEGTANHVLITHKKQVWTLESSTTNQTHTSITVKGRLITNDGQVVPIANGPTHFIWAIGSANEVEKRGTAFVNILEGELNAEH